jgi:DNA helicase II / ATP-dependent DNA helicase PcrA
MLSYPEFVITVRAAIPRFQQHWLNTEQDQAVQGMPTPPTFIVAGPGAGKTTVLVLRILKLILVDQVAPARIVATTFTRKAAAELRSRVLSWGFATMSRALADAAAGNDTPREDWLRNTDINAARTGTLDSLAEQFLVECRGPGEIIPSTIEGFLAKSLMRREGMFPQQRHRDPQLDALLGALGLTTDYSNTFADKLRAVSSIADRMRHDLIDLTAYGAMGAGRQVLVDAINGYTAYLDANNLTDFGRLEHLVLTRLQNNQLASVVNGLDALLIDEFQDTNYLQEQIYLELCRQSNASLTVVGDDDQSIYRFRGATVEIFANFQNRIVQALGAAWMPNRVDLFRNYRSTRRVVNFCQHFIEMDQAFQAARAPGKISLVAHAPHAAVPQRNVPVIGMFRTDVQTLADDLTQMLWSIFSGPGFPVACADSAFTISAPQGGDFGDSVMLAHSVRERTPDPNNPRDRLPLLLRQSLHTRGVRTFNPRGQSLSAISAIQRLLGLGLECIDPNGTVLNAIPATSMTQTARAKMNGWRLIAQQFIASNPTPGGLGQFVQGWRTRTPGGIMGTWPRDWPLLELVFTLTTWFPEFQDNPEGQVYLEAIARTISEVGQMASYGARILRGNNVHDDSSVREAIRSVFESFATDSIEVDEEVMPYVPRNYFPIMTVHQAKGLEFPLVIVDVGSDYKTNHPKQRRNRCPEQGDSVHRVESDVVAHCAIGPLRTARSDLNRAWDDIRRLYFVAFSRPENVLVLAGLTSQIRTNPVRCISTGHRSDGTNGLTFVTANQWTLASPPGTVALV